MAKKNYSLLRMTPSKESRDLLTAKPDLVELNNETGSEAVNSAKTFAFWVHLGFKYHPAYPAFIKSTPPRIADYFEAGDFSRDGWYSVFTHGLFVSLLSKDDIAFSRLCEWAKPKVKRDDYCPADEEELIAPLVVAGLFQSKPSVKFRQNADKVVSSRKKEFKLLGKALISLFENDQGLFESSVREHVQIYQTKPLPQVSRAGKLEIGTTTHMERWCSIPMNIIYQAGLKLGMADPKFPPEIMAYLVTPKSAGLA